MKPDREPAHAREAPPGSCVTGRHRRLYAEMFEQLAPATEGRIVSPGRKRRGRLVFGDDTGQPR